MRLRQPVLIAYIIVGIVAGPAVLGLVTHQDQIDLLAQVGVAVLLFAVGLKLDLPHVRHIGPVALATGLGQLGFTIFFAFALILLMGKSVMEALYVAVALTFSSTIIIIKLLSDKRELDALHGRIAVGFLIVQDLAVVLAMMGMSALRGGAEVGLVEIVFSLVWRVTVAFALLYVVIRYVLPRVVALMARFQELLLIFAIAWGTGLAALGEWAGFSKEAGTFLAGFSLASTAYRDAINARLAGIRDFLLLFFFIDLGAKLDFATLGGELWPAVVLSLFVLIGNPLFERRRPHRELEVEIERRVTDQPDVIVFGLGRFGERLAFSLKEVELQMLGVDFGPEVAQGMRGKGLAVGVVVIADAVPGVLGPPTQTRAPIPDGRIEEGVSCVVHFPVDVRPRGEE
jgi:Kef-type K+ transport system membrane component KefB